MRKKYLLLITFLLALFSFNVIVFADDETVRECKDGDINYASYRDKAKKFDGKYYCYEEGKEALYCAHGASKLGNDNYILEVDCFLQPKDEKDIEENKDAGVAKITTNIADTKLYTLIGDEVLEKNELWWKTLIFCFNYKVMNIDNDEVKFFDSDSAVFTDSLSSYIYDKGMYNGGKSVCTTFKAVNISSDNLVSTCTSIAKRKIEIDTLLNQYKDKTSQTYHNASLISRYKVIIDEIKTLCSQATQYADYNDACVESCLGINEDINYWSESFGTNYGKKTCGFSSRLIAWMLNIIKWIKYIIPVVVIVLGILDFIKAIASDKDDEVKKAQQKFVKRLIAAALIFLVPLIIEFVLPKFGFDYNSCGLF